MEALTESIRNSGVLEIQDRVSLISGGKVLDVGTQHGNFINVMMKSMKDYEGFLGIDISEEHLEKARDEITDDSVEFKLMNAEDLAFEDDTFDTVAISHSLHHLDNIDTVLGEMLRVLKPGGYLILQEVFSDDDQSEAQMTEILTHHMDAKIERMEGIPHYDTLTRQQIKDIVNEKSRGYTPIFLTVFITIIYFLRAFRGLSFIFSSLEWFDVVGTYIIKPFLFLRGCWLMLTGFVWIEFWEFIYNLLGWDWDIDLG